MCVCVRNGLYPNALFEGAVVLWLSATEGDELHAAAGEEGARGAGAVTPSSRKQLELLVLLLFILRGAHTPHQIMKH